MLIPEYLSISFLELLWKIPVILFTFFLHRLVAHFFFPNRFRLVEASFIGLVITSAMLTILVSFNMMLARLFVIVYLVALVIYQIYVFLSKAFLIKTRLSNKGSLKKYWSFILIFNLLVFIQVLSFNSRDKSQINSHWAYYFGIPAEMLNGSYSGRIRIHDNYPIEYPKYHFFYSSLLANLMRLLGKIEYDDFVLTRILLITLLGLVFYGIVRKNNKQLTSIVIFILGVNLAIFSLAPNLSWALSSTNLISIPVFVLCVIYLIKNQFHHAFIYLGIFSLTSARSLLPAVAIAVYLSHKKIKAANLQQVNWRYAVLIVLLVINWATMLFTGSDGGDPISETLNLQLLKPYYNLVNPGWLVLLSSGVFPHGILNFSSLPAVGPSFINWTILLLMTLGVSFSKKINCTNPRLNQARILLIMLYCVPIIVNLISIPKAFQISSVILNYAIPILSVILLSPAYLRGFVKVFIIISFFQLYIFSGGFSVPNWALFEWLWLLLIIYHIKNISLKSLPIFALFILMLLNFTGSLSPVKNSEWFQPSDSDRTTHKLVFLTTSNNDSVSTCDNLLLLLRALEGNRVFYDSGKLETFSISKLFVPEKFSNINYYNCRN
jgi:hypothetical protein